MKRIIRDRLLTTEESKEYQAMREDPELYEIAKDITLKAGFPWTDPRTLKTYYPPRNKTTNQ